MATPKIKNKAGCTTLTKPRKLNLCHRKAIDVLLSGATVQETADSVGKARQTVSEWVNHFPAFQDRLAELRSEQDEEQKSAFASTRGFALTRLRRLMADDKGEVAFKAITYFLDNYGPKMEGADPAGGLSESDVRLLSLMEGRHPGRTETCRIPRREEDV